MSATALLLAMISSCSPQDPGPGISRALAAERAALVSKVAYDLTFDCAPGMDEVNGSIRLFFDLPDTPPTAPIVLDFGGEDLVEVSVNGVEITEPKRVHDHVVLPASALNPGRNEFVAEFTSGAAPTGTPLSVYRDPTSSEEFVYTLLVPADAHGLFPCFDQPDLKARFSLRLQVPLEWQAVANAPRTEEPEPVEGGQVFTFEETPPLPTYLFAFAAGPFEIVTRQSSARPPLRLFVRRSKTRDLDAATLLNMHRESVRWLEGYFARDYPFRKLDLVLLPGFPYGGMEHAGAIFYRETALIFDHAPTESEQIRRSTLIYHEVSHQWFGNLVTMEWFDDLWLKEGFATYIGYRVLAELEPARNAWLRFLQRVKPRAYRIDVTEGTTPIYQELDNLDDAKSAYGAIVYNKAPAVLRELQGRVGERAFRDGMQSFLTTHAFGNARWQDLVQAIEETSGTELTAWSARWILARGMPTVRAVWKADAGGRVTEFALAQEGTVDEGTWPLQVGVSIIDAQGHPTTFDIAFDTATVQIERMLGRPAPACVLLNPGDVAYGRFLLDARSQEYLLEHLPDWSDPLTRAVALTALFDTVRATELAPARYATLARKMLESERDPASHAWLLDSLTTTIGRYLQPAAAKQAADDLAVTLVAALREGMPGLALHTFRALLPLSANDAVLTLCEELLDGGSVPHLELGTADRYRALAALIAADRAGERPAAMTGSATPKDAEKYAYLALAARPTQRTKDAYFDSYLQPTEPPEQWMQDSLAFFHWPGQGELTLPYLRRALDKVDWVKANRRIFFMPAWIDGFVNGHSSRAALDIVDGFLKTPTLSPDIRRKTLESVDGLRRAVRIKDKWK